MAKVAEALTDAQSGFHPLVYEISAHPNRKFTVAVQKIAAARFYRFILRNDPADPPLVTSPVVDAQGQAVDNWVYMEAFAPENAKYYYFAIEGANDDGF